jgi:thiol-disulfide isomerase/thioredoxin
MRKPMVLALLLFATAWLGSARPASLPTLPEVLARRFEVVTLEGETVTLAELTGHDKPVVLEFWATWCIPCRETVPHLVKLHQRYANQGLVVLGLTLESPARDLRKVRLFAEQHGIRYPLAYAPLSLYQFMNNSRDVGIPRLFVFDAQGEIVTRLTGYSPSAVREIEAGAERALRSLATAPETSR